MTGDELESLQLDATANGVNWSDGNNNETGYNYVTNTTSTDATPSAALLPFLTAFASTG